MQWLILIIGILTGDALAHSAPVSTSATNNLVLSTEERQWITNHPVVRVGITPDWAPFSYFGPNGEAVGIDIEILELIRRRTGLQFEIIATESWDETLNLVRKKRIDCTTGTAETSEREDVFHFTRAYYSSPVVIVSRERDLRFYNISTLGQASISMPRNYVTTTELSKRLPNARVVLSDTLLDAFRLVTQKSSDATVANMITTSRYLNDHPELNLIICGVTDETFPLRLAVRKDVPLLTGILDKGLASISTAEFDYITSRHLPFGLEAAERGGVLKRRWVKSLIVGIIFALGVLLWIRSMLKELRARRRIETELREINESLEVFSYTISHDLRAPLRTIRGFAAILMEDYKDKLSAEANDYLERMNSAAARMDNLISDVLAYSQASRSTLPLHKVDLNQLINLLIKEFPPHQQSQFHVDPNLPGVLGNQALLSQAIANLLNNAVKFIPSDRKPDIHVRSESIETSVKLWVEDNGIGIAPENRERIFKMFERIDARQYEGSGIGLAVVAKAVEKMGGHVGVESEFGKGSRFWIELPSAEGEKPEPRRSTERPKLPLFPKLTKSNA